MKLNHLLDLQFTAQRLRAADLPPGQVARVALRYKRLARRLLKHHPKDADAYALFVPGRVEVLGKHTDYAGGHSLTFATGHGFALVAVASGEPVVQIEDLATGEGHRFALWDGQEPAQGHWTSYPMTAARRLAANFDGTHCGGHLVFESDLPAAAGMSSSSALLVASFLALREINALQEHHIYQRYFPLPLHLAQYLSMVESGSSYGPLVGDAGVGTRGGSQDHTAILCSATGHITHYRYAPTQILGRFAVPEGLQFVIAASGVTAAKTGGAQARYNRAADEAAEIAHVWQSATCRPDYHLYALTQAPSFDLEDFPSLLRRSRHLSFDPERLHRRFQHFMTEEALVAQAARALSAGDLFAFRESVSASQEAATTLLGNQVPETRYLCDVAYAEGALAASAFGAGFGGAVWALVYKAEAQAFLNAWSHHYGARFPRSFERSAFFCVDPGPGAFVLDDPH